MDPVSSNRNEGCAPWRRIFNDCVKKLSWKGQDMEAQWKSKCLIMVLDSILLLYLKPAHNINYRNSFLSFKKNLGRWQSSKLKSCHNENFPLFEKVFFFQSRDKTGSFYDDVLTTPGKEIRSLILKIMRRHKENEVGAKIHRTVKFLTENLMKSS